MPKTCEHVFRSKSGAEITRTLSPDELMNLPLLEGSFVIRERGKIYFRVKPTAGTIGIRMMAGAYDANSYPKLSKALPQFADGAESVKEPGRNFGCPIITSRQHENYLAAKHGFTREYDCNKD